MAVGCDGRRDDRRAVAIGKPRNGVAGAATRKTSGAPKPATVRRRSRWPPGRSGNGLRRRTPYGPRLRQAVPTRSL